MSASTLSQIKKPRSWRFEVYEDRLRGPARLVEAVTPTNLRQMFGVCPH